MSAKRRPTQVDVARLARTSRQTVSLVVRDDPRVAPQTRSRVLSAMDELDYRPNIAARALAAHNSRFIGITLVGITNPFYADLCDALRSRCEERGLIPLVAISGRHRDSCIVCAERLVHMGVEGLTVVSPPLGAEDLDRIGTQVPTVLLTHNSGPGSVDLVHTDESTSCTPTTRPGRAWRPATCSRTASSPSPTSATTAPSPGTPPAPDGGASSRRHDGPAPSRCPSTS